MKIVLDLEHPIWYMLAFLGFVGFVYCFMLKKKFSFPKMIMMSMLYWYMVIVVDVSYLFMHVSVVNRDDVLLIRQGAHINLIPFESIGYYMSDWFEGHREVTFRQIGSNLLLFLPLGFFLSILLPQKVHIKNLLIWAIGVSLIKELSQLVLVFFLYFVCSRLSYAAFDVDDILLNSLGFIIGFSLYRLFFLIFLQKKKSGRGFV